MSKVITKKDRQEIAQIVKEDKECFFIDKQLTLKLSAKEMRKALLKDSETREPIAEFAPSWYSFLEDYRKYRVNKVDNFKLVLDDSADQNLRDAFSSAWHSYFKEQIVQANDDFVSERRKIKLYSIFGTLIIAIVIALVCATHFTLLNHMDESTQKTAWFIALYVLSSIFGYGIYVFGWGMLWDMFTNIFGDHRKTRTKLSNLLLLYNAKFEYVPFNN